MCPSQDVEAGCAITACDDACRNRLACRLGNASQLDILDCAG